MSIFFFFKQKTAYEMRISDWSSDVCSSDLSIGTPWPMIPFIAPIEFVSFMVRPFSLGLRLFVAMTAGHVLLEVFANFIVQSSSAGAAIGLPVGQIGRASCRERVCQDV